MLCAVRNVLILCPVLVMPCLRAQEASGQRDRTLPNPPALRSEQPKRVFWIIPNYRTSPSLASYKPLTDREKFKIAVEDSFDPGTIVLAAAFAGQGQISKSSPSFGQGVKGYAHYFATSYADLAIGDWMTEAIYPTLLHQDPRYFRRGTGSVPSRLLYAASQIVWTHTDSGAKQVNYSELAGNATAAALSNAYYPDSRTAGEAAARYGTQIGLDVAGNMLKEFWPDIYNKLARKHHP